MIDDPRITLTDSTRAAMERIATAPATAQITHLPVNMMANPCEKVLKLTLLPPVDNTADWPHKDVWKKYGNGFCVEISRHNSQPYMQEQGSNHWHVCAYIYPDHPRFSMFDGSEYYQAAASELPLHAGPSYLYYHASGIGKILSVQVGTDYFRLGDNDYTHFATKEDAVSVFLDANNLAKFLETEALTQSQPAQHRHRVAGGPSSTKSKQLLDDQG